jgi:putative transposase
VAHHPDDSKSVSRALEILTENGLDGMARALEIVLDEAMKLERAEFVGAAPYERSEQRTAHANGFKPRRFHSRIGPLELSVPQVRGVVEGRGGFYP